MIRPTYALLSAGLVFCGIGIATTLASTPNTFCYPFDNHPCDSPTASPLGKTSCWGLVGTALPTCAGSICNRGDGVFDNAIRSCVTAPGSNQEWNCILQNVKKRCGDTWQRACVQVGDGCECPGGNGGDPRGDCNFEECASPGHPQ